MTVLLFPFLFGTKGALLTARSSKVQYENPVYKERTPDIQIFQWTLDKTLRCVWLHPKVTDGGKLGKYFADSLLEFAGR